MNDPAKKANQTPESHTPKAMPEILNLAAVVAAQPPAAPQARAENTLQGIPKLRYGDPSPVCFIGSVLRLMDYIGDPIDQSELFALSGAGLCFPWAAGSSCDEISVIPEIPRRTFAALGYASEYFFSAVRQYTKEFYMEKIRESIDNGRPVIGFGFTVDYFTCLITGYYNNGEGLYLRAFWSPKGTPEGYDDESYYSVDDWYGKCGGILVVGEKIGERLTGERAYAHIRESARIFGQMTTLAAQGTTIHMGFDAFDAMAAWLRSGGEDWDLHDGGIFLKPAGILLLQYYRNSLREYLEKLDQEYPGVANPAVISAITRMGGLVHGRESSDWRLEAIDRKLKRFSNMRKPELREKVAVAVERLKALDEEVFAGLGA